MLAGLTLATHYWYNAVCRRGNLHRACQGTVQALCSEHESDVRFLANYDYAIVDRRKRRKQK